MGLSRLSIRWCWVGLYHGLFKKLWNNLKNSSNTWRWEVIQETLRWFHHKIEDGTYYTWFLEYQDFLDPSLALGSSIKDFRVRLLMRTWRYIDGWPLPIDTAFNDINIEKATWLEYKRDCFNLCELVLSDVRRDILSCVVIVWLLHNPQPVSRNATRNCLPYSVYEMFICSIRLMIPVLSSNSSVPRI